MTIAEFCFKVCITCVVLVIAASLAIWIGLLDGAWGLVKLLGIVAGISLLAGIIVGIWEGYFE